MEKQKESGFIGLIISIIISLILLQAVFRVDVIEILKSPNFGEIVDYIKKFFTLVWEKFLVLPASFIWNEIFIDIVWRIMKDAFELLKNWVDTNQA